METQAKFIDQFENEDNEINTKLQLFKKNVYSTDFFLKKIKNKWVLTINFQRTGTKELFVYDSVIKMESYGSENDFTFDVTFGNSYKTELKLSIGVTKEHVDQLIEFLLPSIN